MSFGRLEPFWGYALIVGLVWLGCWAVLLTRRRKRLDLRAGPIWVPFVYPVLVLVALLVHFTFAHSHPTVQFAGADNPRWTSWMHLWPPLLAFGLANGLVVAGIGAFHLGRQPLYFLCHLGLTGLAWWCVAENFPSA